MKRGVTTWLDAFSSAMSVFFDLETDLLIVLDECGEIDRLNAAGEHRLGYGPGSLQNVPLMSLIAMGDLTTFIEDCRHVDMDIGAMSHSFRLLKRGGGMVRVRLVKFHFNRLSRQSYLILRPDG